MLISEIREMPTSVKEIPFGATGVHESLTRAWNILERVKWYLSQNVPAHIIRELIDEMEKPYSEQKNR